ncbi:MAG: NAD(P)-dependent oxidoreductase [Hyphomicrobiaceae bacterium]
MAAIAVLGLGKMGTGIAQSLAQAGHSVRAWNRSADKVQNLSADGIVLAATPADAAREADAIISMVADDEASARVWLEADGGLAGAKAGAFAIECSTISYGHVARLQREATGRGLRYIDCPVNGGPAVAAQGKLALLVGASGEDLAAARPVLESFSGAILYFGAVGTGTAFKLINNLMGAVQIAGLAEGVALANRLGLDQKTLIAAIETGPCASPHVKRLVTGMVEGRQADVFALAIGLREKDARYALGMADAQGVGMAVGTVAHRWYAAAKPAHAADDDSLLVATVVERAGRV